MSNRALSPTMVGRQQQLAELDALLDLARSSAGQVVFLAGEAGVGKTRLVREFVQEKGAAQDLGVYIGHCLDERPAPPYGPFAELLRSLNRISAGEPLGKASGIWADELPDLAYRIADARLDPLADRRRLFQEIFQALRPESGHTNLLILEDLHWSDEASQDLLHYLGRAIERERVLIVGTYRSDELPRLHPLAGLIARLTRDRRYHEIRLAPLSRTDLAQMLDATLGEPPPIELLETLYERTEGNPFFTEEVLESLISNGMLTNPGSTSRPGRRFSTVAIPVSIKDSILRRVADLDPAAAAVLRDAAVIGRRFDFDLLLRLTRLDEPALLSHLAQLVERQLIAEEPDGLEDHYRFRHELIREAIYEEMLRRERRIRHQEVLRALEERSADQPETAIDQRAYHASHARNLAQAARYCELAGDRAITIHAYRNALARYEDALEAIDQTEPDEPQRAALLTKLGHAAYQMGDLQRSAGYWREALPIYQHVGEPHRVADIQRWLGRIAWELNDKPGAFAQTRAALATLDGLPPSRELAMVYSALGHLYMLSIYDEIDNGSAASAEECIAWGTRALELADSLGDDAVRTHALNNIGVALCKLDRNEEGLANLKRSLEIARAADLPADIVRAYINYGGRLCHEGQREQGARLLHEGWTYVTSHGYIRGTSKLLKLLAYAKFELGAWNYVNQLIEEVLRPDYAGPAEDRSLMQLFRALLLWQRGQPALARDLLEAQLRTCSDPDDGFHIEYHLIYIYCSLGDMESALALADRLLATIRTPEGGLPQAYRLTSVALAYIEAKRYAQAEEIIAAMERVLKPQNQESYDAGLLAELRGMACLDTNPNQAVELLARSLAICERFNLRIDAGRLQRLTATALLRRSHQGDRDQANRLLHKARTLAEQIGSVAEIEKIDTLKAPTVSRAGSSIPLPGLPEGLTPRELEVLRLITRGLTNRAIAETLIISEKTAEVHVRNILSKLGLSSRTQAATYAIERGLLRAIER